MASTDVDPNIQVLVVDDQLDAAQDFASLIEKKTGLRTEFCVTPRRAEEIAKNSGVTTVVLDERMPEMSGTNLWLVLQKIDPKLQAIMLTGQAEREDLEEALNTGFARYVQKAQIAELPAVVLECHIAYEVNRAQLDPNGAENAPVLLETSRWRPFKRQRVRFSLVAAEITGEHVVLAETWSTKLLINAGHSVKHTYSEETAESVVFSSETRQRLATDLKLTPGNLDFLGTSLSSELETMVSESTSRSKKETASTEETFSLPAEPADPSVVHVRARHIQSAPSYTQFRLTLAIDCSSCGLRVYKAVPCWVHDGSFATRHADYFSDGEVKEIDTGHVRR